MQLNYAVYANIFMNNLSVFPIIYFYYYVWVLQMFQKKIKLLKNILLIFLIIGQMIDMEIKFKFLQILFLISYSFGITRSKLL